MMQMQDSLEKGKVNNYNLWNWRIIFFFLVRGSRALKEGGGVNPKRVLYFLGGTDGHFIRLIKIPEKKN